MGERENCPTFKNKSRHPVEHEFDATFGGMRQFKRAPRNNDEGKF